MQDRYVGDIGDYGKYGLLKALVADDLSLGVVWYLNADIESNGDGAFTGYLADGARLRPCDPPLFDALAGLVRTGRRSVAAVREARLLPEDTVFWEAPLHLGGRLPAARRTARADWLSGAVAATRGSQLVFLDPDNGIAGGRVTTGQRACAKYVLLEDLDPFLARGQSLVIYHHQTRQGTLQEQMARWLDVLAGVPRVGAVWALTFHRQQVRAYFVLGVDEHIGRLGERVSRIETGPWGKHFRLAGTRVRANSGS